MALADEFKTQVLSTFQGQWDVREGKVVPTPKDLVLGNEAIHFERATVLYADLVASTALVDTTHWFFSAEVYKSYLHCVAKLVRAEGGTITSYDGDRLMGVFIGDSQSTDAARCALKINYAVKNIVTPAIKTQYVSSSYQVKHVVGIDTSQIHVARTGVRGDNDLVWIGRAANYAAKLTQLRLEPATWITKAVFDKLAHKSKYGGNPETLMWKKWNWSQMNNIEIYSSTWWWVV
jgi:class 3 adenylate cyclase